MSRNGLTTKLLENLKSEIDILKSLTHRHITRLIDVIVRLFPFSPLTLPFPLPFPLLHSILC